MENERKPKDLGQVAKPYAVLLLCIVSVLINFLGAQLALWLKLPLFLDTIGTVLSAALGGFLPGIAVGFVTNLINSFADASSAYYGALNAVAAGDRLRADRRRAQQRHRLASERDEHRRRHLRRPGDADVRKRR